MSTRIQILQLHFDCFVSCTNSMTFFGSRCTLFSTNKATYLFQLLNIVASVVSTLYILICVLVTIHSKKFHNFWSSMRYDFTEFENFIDFRYLFYLVWNLFCSELSRFFAFVTWLLTWKFQLTRKRRNWKRWGERTSTRTSSCYRRNRHDVVVRQRHRPLCPVPWDDSAIRVGVLHTRNDQTFPKQALLRHIERSGGPWESLSLHFSDRPVWSSRLHLAYGQLHSLHRHHTMHRFRILSSLLRPVQLLLNRHRRARQTAF